MADRERGYLHVSDSGEQSQGPAGREPSIQGSRMLGQERSPTLHPAFARVNSILPLSSGDSAIRLRVSDIQSQLLERQSKRQGSGRAAAEMSPAAEPEAKIASNGKDSATALKLKIEEKLEEERRKRAEEEEVVRLHARIAELQEKLDAERRKKAAENEAAKQAEAQREQRQAADRAADAEQATNARLGAKRAAAERREEHEGDTIRIAELLSAGISMRVASNNATRLKNRSAAAIWVQPPEDVEDKNRSAKAVWIELPEVRSAGCMLQVSVHLCVSQRMHTSEKDDCLFFNIPRIHASTGIHAWRSIAPGFQFAG